MDILKQNQLNTFNCIKHPDNRVQYIQVKEIQDYKSVFYCQYCLNDDEDFRIQNYILSDIVLKDAGNQIIDRWPPILDNSLYKKIQQYIQQDYKIFDKSSKIEQFFESMKSQIVEKLEQVKKFMLQKEQQYSNINHVLEKYNQLSRIKQLKCILTDSNMNSKQKEDKFRQFIKELEQQKYNNTVTFESLIESNEKSIDFEALESIKSSVLQCIDQFNITQKSIKVYKQIDILPTIKMNKTNYDGSQLGLQIVKSQSNQILISSNIDSWTNCVSDFILDLNTKYVFRFQINNKSKTESYAAIGLVSDNSKDQICGFYDNLSCYFVINSNSFYYGNYGIDKKEKGDFSVLRQDQKTIELRVGIKEGQLQVLDYPKYNHILSITDNHILNLREKLNLRLYIGIRNKNMSIQLTEAHKLQ